MKYRFQDNGIFSFPEVLERIGQLRLKGSLRVETEQNGFVGDIFINDGKIVGAEIEGASGEKALDAISKQPSAQITFFEGVSPQRPNIDAQVTGFLLEYVMANDNTRKLDPQRKSGSAQINDTNILTKSLQLDNKIDSSFFLDVVQGDERIAIRKVANVVGREATSDITLSDASVSRRHCVIRCTGRGLHVTDLGSTNGTRVNNHLLQEGFINPGDKLEVGDIELMVARDEAAGHENAERAKADDAELNSGPLLNPRLTSQIEISQIPETSTPSASPQKDMAPPYLSPMQRPGAPTARPIQERVGSRTGAPQVPSSGNPVDGLQIPSKKG